MKKLAIITVFFSCLAFSSSSASGVGLVDNLNLTESHRANYDSESKANALASNNHPKSPIEGQWENTFLEWLRDGPGSRALTDGLKETIYSNKGQFLKVILGRPIKSSAFHEVKINSIDDFKDQKIFSLLKKKRNTFATSDKLIIIYYERENRSWYLQTYDPSTLSKSLAMGKRIALSKCINSVDGGTGAVSSLFRASVHMDSHVQTPSDLINPANNNVILSMAGRIQVGNTIKVSGTVTCILGDKQFAQPYVYPLYFQVPEGKKAQIRFENGNGIKVVGSWEKTPAFSKLAAASPLIECHIGNSSHVCDPGAGEGLRIADLKNLVYGDRKNGY